MILISRKLFTVFLCLITFDCLSEPFIDKHVKDKSLIFLGRVTGSEELEFSFGEKINSCGINYTVRVLMPLRGDVVAGEIKLFSPHALHTSGEYLFALNEPPVEPERLVKWPTNYEKVFSECEKELNKKTAYIGDYFQVLEHPDELDGEWLKVWNRGVSFHYESHIIKDEYGVEFLLVPWESVLKEIQVLIFKSE